MSKLEDQFDGQGGSYVIDPKTGLRELVERTEDQAKDQPQEQQAADKPEVSE